MRPKIGTQPTESEDEPTQPETEEKSTLQAIPASKPKFDENFLSSSEYRLPCNALDMVELELTRQAYFVPESVTRWPSTVHIASICTSNEPAQARTAATGARSSTNPSSDLHSDLHSDSDGSDGSVVHVHVFVVELDSTERRAPAVKSFFARQEEKKDSQSSALAQSPPDLSFSSVTQRDSNCFAQSSIYPRFSTNHLTTISSFTTTLTPGLTPTTSLPTAPLSPSPTPSRPPDAAPPQVTSLDTQIAQIPQSYSLHSSSQPTQQGRVSLTLEELEANLRQKPAGFSGMDGYGGRSQ
ncbi:hypothetical protein BLNAU_14102 [Blattamonas nauphoetae]|uniref:Uncharacterized protein n=1 Tax=Blattamonas nauphoetae TaxID=2049346 RepID=A0ABQ9XHU5_9EUKA|nr:hypothetical protein BLNAU_14102 [Blattamonas nauphoetae]